MGIVTKTVEMMWTRKNKRYYIDKNYKYTKCGDIFNVNVYDLQNGSNKIIDIECDGENCNSVMNIPMSRYNKRNHDGKYYCKSCSAKLFGCDKKIRKKLQTTKSFEQWCIENNRQDILDRWDYKLNELNPSEVSRGSEKSFYFKCKIGIHESEPRQISYVTENIDYKMICNKCNSFAQFLIDSYGDNALNLYWDYESNTLNPWLIPRNTNKKVWIKCQEKDYHKSYNIFCNDFVSGKRCGFCASVKIHPKDSLGQYIVDNYGEEFLASIWSEKNKKTAFEYSLGSQQRVWWKCINKEHKDYTRSVYDERNSNFTCLLCSNLSKGENVIEKYLNTNKFIYQRQVTYNNLRGIGNGLLSYDFFIEGYGLIEYQGEYHDGTANNQTEERFKIQQEHDRRKKQYCIDNNIRLLEIWYWDYKNIEEILNKELIKYGLLKENEITKAS